MFTHGKTGKIYYSVREKIDYYSAVIKGQIDAPAATKRKAKTRLKTLQKLESQKCDEPFLIVTDDKFFGNGISKPRAVVVIQENKDKTLKVAPLLHRDTSYIILDKNTERQISNNSNGKVRNISRNDVYELKNISNVPSLTKYDKEKIIKVFSKKNRS